MSRIATYHVALTECERKELRAISAKGRGSVRRALYVRALLLLDEGDFAETRWKVGDVATAVGMVRRTVENLKRRFVEEGLDGVLERKERETPLRAVVFGGDFEALPKVNATNSVP